jgi:hypothetical protein
VARLWLYLVVLAIAIGRLFAAGVIGAARGLPVRRPAAGRPPGTAATVAAAVAAARRLFIALDLAFSRLATLRRRGGLGPTRGTRLTRPALVAATAASRFSGWPRLATRPRIAARAGIAALFGSGLVVARPPIAAMVATVSRCFAIARLRLSSSGSRCGHVRSRFSGCFVAAFALRSPARRSGGGRNRQGTGAALLRLRLRFRQ